MDSPDNEVVARQIESLIGLAQSFEDRGDMQDARRCRQQLLALCQQHFSNDHYLIKANKSQLAWHDWYDSLPQSDRDLFKKADGFLDDAERALSDGRFSEWLANLQAAERIEHQIKHPPNVHMAILQENLAAALLVCNSPREALAHANSSYKIATECDGDCSPLAATSLRELSAVHLGLGNLHESLREACRSCRVFAACGQQESTDYAQVLLTAMPTLIGIDEWNKADRCIAEIEKISAHESPELNSVSYVVGLYKSVVLTYERNPRAALANIDKVLALVEKTYGRGHHVVADTELEKGYILLQLGDIDAAKELIERASASSTNDHRPPVVEATRKPEIQASLLIAQHRFEDALQMLAPMVGSRPTSSASEASAQARLLQLYSSAARQLHRDDNANKAIEKSAAIDESFRRVRDDIRADPQCKFPWEEAESNR